MSEALLLITTPQATRGGVTGPGGEMIGPQSSIFSTFFS